MHLTHLGAILYTAGQLLEQLQQREEAPENAAVRNVQSTQLQQEDRLHQHDSQRHTGTGFKGNDGNVSPCFKIQIDAIYHYQNIFLLASLVWHGISKVKTLQLGNTVTV